ncbi:phage major tail tube protein [Sulfurimonas sp.]|uniref:phage major tail tube protein n=1 Tax=Sulfurimonas sp. TaxID=2022749 RepID=UPI002B473552|nr:phage major tail tube protein [Sulfurimonas sp.]
MKNQVSHVIARADIFVVGVGFIGVGTYTSPELKWKKITNNGAAGEYDLVYGAVEKLEASMKFTVTNDVLFEAALLLNNATIICSEALATEDGAKGRRDVLIGAVDIKESESKPGEVKESEISMSPHYWLKESSGVPVIEIDKKKDIVRIMGKDVLEEIRKAVGG